ncbi:MULTISPECIES: phosphatidate cytidylyltransferase [Methylotenera]|uniref:phosphatidate cytidylyltransferase n=1 Tax=Methylotenera TaxID=359407 RepID=UPI000365C072|nr:MULTISPECIES: phosphatidate cytidylyltransferase [Methylotenera]
MLKTRIITAGLLVAAFIPALFMLSNTLWAYCMLAISLLALQEWGAMIKLSVIQNSVYLVVAGLAGILVVWLMTQYGFHLFFFKSLIVFFITALFWLLIVPFWFKSRYLVSNKCVMALLGLLLITSLWLALICAKGADPALLLVLLATIWIADSAAYFAGKNFGKHKLAPNISPGKTWEGVFGALVAVTVFGAILYFGFDFKEWAVFPALWTITMLGVAGDLFESMIKRQAMIKDSGSLLPGHGGILDRIDGIIPSLPIAILMIYLFHYFNNSVV